MRPYFSSVPDVVQNRWLGFLIWQIIFATSIFLLISPLLGSPSTSLLSSLASFLIFLLSVFVFSFSLFLTSTPQSEPSASLSELGGGFLRALIKALVGGFQSPSFSPEFRRRVCRTMKSLALISVCAASGWLSVVSMCCDLERLHLSALIYFGSGGLVFGLLFGSHYVYQKRWVLQFPIVQRPLFFSFKIGLFSAFKQALKLSFSAIIGCALLTLLWSEDFMRGKTFGQLIILQIRLLICISAVSFCWEVSRHLLEVLHTRRFLFTPAPGSAAAESNPNEALLEALEQSSPASLFQYLAYLDLCLASESDFELWRRAPLFEETGETYKRLISLCLRPLEQFTLGLAEAFEGFYADKSISSSQLRGPTNAPKDFREAFDKLQLMTWCARTVAALTSRSHKEDRYGVAQLTSCNSAAVSTLLSCLLAVEFTMGRKPSPPAARVSPVSIKWATVGQTGTPSAGSSRRRDAGLEAKAFAMADVLRRATYQIVSAFEDDMLASTKASSLQKNWISEKPLYGTRDVLAQKLSLFLEYRAV
ncbi:nucleoporin protein Ndc1-Nup protein [Wolffia australiana]